MTSCLLCPQSVHASLLHSGPESWGEAGATQSPPPAPLPPGRDLWPRGSAVGADGLQRFAATDLLTQRRLLGGRTDTFTHWHWYKRRYDSQMYYLPCYIQKDRKWNMRVKFSPSWIRTRRIWALHVSVIIFSHVFTRNVFNFLFKINQMRVDELLHL